MKNKILIIPLFILFAIPIPISILVISMCVIWILGVLIEGLHFLEIIKVLILMIISISYIFIYVYALKKTWNENKITAKTFLPIAHYLLAFVAFLILINFVGQGLLLLSFIKVLSHSLLQYRLQPIYK